MVSDLIPLLVVHAEGQERGKGSLFEGEFAQVDVIFRCRDQVDLLSEDSLERRLRSRAAISARRWSDALLRRAHLVEELHDKHVVRLGAEMVLEKVIYPRFEHVRVIDRDVTDPFLRRVWTGCGKSE